MKEAIWIMIWSLSLPSTFFLAYLFEKPKLKKKNEQRKIWQRRRNFADSITDAGERVKRELALDRAIKSEIKKSAEPIRKACGLFSGEDAQVLLKKRTSIAVDVPGALIHHTV